MNFVHDTLASHPLARKFEQLEPAHVFQAVEATGRRCTGRFFALNSYENRVYQVEVETGPAIVAKFYRPGRWSIDALEDEHDFIFELAEAGVSVSQPLVHADGYSVASLEQGIHYALYERVRGRVKDEPNEQELEQLGRALGLIHNVGERRPAHHRPRLDVATWGVPSLDAINHSGMLPTPVEIQYNEFAEKIFDFLTGALDIEQMHRIHGDCHHANILWDGPEPVFLDFDDCISGPSVQDVWMLAPSADTFGQRRRQHLLYGYEQARDFDHADLQLIEPLRALRMIRYSGWVTRRWHDQTFQRTFAHFLTDQYWYDEVNRLREVVDTLSG